MDPLEAIAFLTWIFPFIGSGLSIILLKFGNVKNYIVVFLLFLSSVLSSILLTGVLSSQEGYFHSFFPWIPSLGINVGIYVDTLAAFMAVIVSWLCFLIALYSLKYMEGDDGLVRYWFFFSFFTGSMLLLILSDNLLLFFIGWEGTGLASYALIGHWYRDEQHRYVGDPGRSSLGVSMYFSPSHSGIRAIAFTRIGDVGLIVGIVILYLLTGTMSIPEIASLAQVWGGELASRGLLLPFLLIFSLGALAKSAQFPFHEWLVTAMTGPTSVSALIHAATMVKAGVYFMLRFSPIFFLLVSFNEVNTYFIIIAYIGAFTAFFMATQAIVAKELKLVLAFSTASQLGYMFLAIGSAGLLNEFALGFLSCFNHLISHAIFKAALFMGAGAVIHTVHSRFLDDMGGLSKYMRITFLTMLIAALSLSGLPPLMGFWTKDGILETVFESGLQLPFILAVITASITAFYSMKIVFRTFTMQESNNVKHLVKEHKIHEANLVMWLPYAICAIASLIGGLLWFFFAGNLNNAILGHVLALENTHLAFNIHLDPFTTTLSILMVAIGISAAILAYSGPKYAEMLNKLRINNPLLKTTYNFLYDRWYINSIYYRIIVNGFSWLSRNIFKWFDSFIIDNIYHAVLPWITTSSAKGIFRLIETDIIDKSYHVLSVKIARFFSNAFRSLQTGRVNHYLLTFLIGFVLIITFLIIWVI